MNTRTSATIIEGVHATKSLGTCARLLALAGLDKVLQSEGDYTLFAPTDQAFADMPAGALDSLEKDPSLLRGTLEDHILGVGRELKELRNGKLATLQGALLTASVTDDGVQLDHANTRGYPMRCANGVIHQIDAVLFPGFTRELSARATEDSAWSGRRREPRGVTVTPTTAAEDAEALFEKPRNEQPSSPA